MLPWKQRKRHILHVDQNLLSVYFSLANFQLVSCNLSLAMIWQMTYTHKLPKLCSATLKSEFALPQTYRAYSISFNSSNVGKFFWSWIIKDCIKVQKKKKKIVVRLFPSSTKRKIRQFHVVVVVVQRRQRNVQKSVMHVQSCCFACLNLLLFFAVLVAVAVVVALTS